MSTPTASNGEAFPGPLGPLLSEAGLADLSVHNQTSTVDRSNEVYRINWNPQTYEVEIDSDITLEDYRSHTNPEAWALLEEFAEPLKGNSAVFINCTKEGGGVAMLRPTLVHMLKLLGVDAHWYVMAEAQNPEDKPFDFTKLMHNISQRQAGDDRITPDGKSLHWRWSVEENGPVLAQQETIQNADFIIIDDPQPAPLIGLLRSVNPNAKFGWRNHIDTSHTLMSDPTTPQGEVASYLLDECGVQAVDFVVAHPIEEFIHPGMHSKTYLAPATIDPFDNLNRHLDDDEIAAGMDFVNTEIALHNARMLAEGREADVVSLLDTDSSRKRITIIARFDESKGLDKAMELGYRVRQKLRAQGVLESELPEVVIVGNGSVDDPSGVPMFEKMLKLRREKYDDDADGIIIMRLKHNYDAINALVSRSTIVTQTSEAEGLETRISDAINHGKPVVISNRGGMKTQVFEGESGIILDYDKPDHDLERGADWIAQMLTDEDKYRAMVESTLRAAERHNRVEFTTVANAIRWLRAFGRVKAGQTEADKTWLLREMVDQRRQQASALGALATA